MKRLANKYAATNVGIGAKMTLGMRDVSLAQDGFMSGVVETDEEKQANTRGVWFAEIKAPGAGHNLMRDDGWERCANVVEAFLNE